MVVTNQERYAMVAAGLQKVYEEKLLPLELDSCFHQFYSPELAPAFFSYRPLILTMGQYSTGKTTFIRRMFEHDYPGMSIGPEPTTDRFIAVYPGQESMQVPGNALVLNQALPFIPLSSFGTSFLSKFEGAKVPSAKDRGVTFVDTPGILSGESKRIMRGYDFEAVMSWFVEHADMILLFFDANKLDISDEFRRCIALVPGSTRKIRIILNKADDMTTEELIRVHGALMWSLGKVLDAPEVARVYMGSFWDQPLRSNEHRAFFEKEMQDLEKHIGELPQSVTMSKVDALSTRARLAKAHVLAVEQLSSSMPRLYGHEAKKAELIESLPNIFEEVSRRRKVPLGDFPDVEATKAKLKTQDWSLFKKLDTKKLDKLDVLLSTDIPDLLKLLPGGSEH